MTIPHESCEFLPCLEGLDQTEIVLLIIRVQMATELFSQTCTRSSPLGTYITLVSEVFVPSLRYVLGSHKGGFSGVVHSEKNASNQNINLQNLQKLNNKQCWTNRKEVITKVNKTPTKGPEMDYWNISVFQQETLIACVLCLNLLILPKFFQLFSAIFFLVAVILSCYAAPSLPPPLVSLPWSPYSCYLTILIAVTTVAITTVAVTTTLVVCLFSLLIRHFTLLRSFSFTCVSLEKQTGQ